MRNSIFFPADILIPTPEINMEKWSMIACDQHSSERDYWDALDGFAGNAPSTLRMMLPEAYLGRDIQIESEKIGAAMQEYLDSGVFRTLEKSFVYVRRRLAGGAVRKGLVGALNLDSYDYSPVTSAKIRATEGTVEDRLPPRIKIRQAAPLEMPHVMVFINDPADYLFSVCEEESRGQDVLYDFDLCAGGGHITGTRIEGCTPAGEKIDGILADLERQPLAMAIGDGNHSLAAAKKSGSKFALVEIVNIHDPAVTFEPIHRVIFDTDTSRFEEELSALRLDTIENYAEKVAAAEEFCKGYVARFGGRVDYIHNDETAREMGSRPGCASLLLPAMEKRELFECVEAHGPFPKKSFSIGRAEDKRYYLECRKI